MIGKTISHYKISDKLGEGGMGVVYKAEDTKLHRSVALKFLSPKILGSDEEKARFVREAHAAAALDHPSICTVHEIDEAEGKTFISMAYIDGRNLHEIIKSGPLAATFLVTHQLQLPARLDEGKGDYIRRLDADGDDAGRSTQTEQVTIKSEIQLTRDAKGVTVKTSFINVCEDHRLRVMFPTALAASHSSAEEPFDVVERPIDRDQNSPWRDTWNPTHPHQRFVDVSDGKCGLALINDGIREYEVTDDKSRTIGLTLLRAFEVALTTVAWRWERHPEMKGSQSLGMHECYYMIYPHRGNWETGQVMVQADNFNVPFLPVQAGPYQGDLPKSHSFLELHPADLMISAVKKAERNEKIILRIYNPTSRLVNGKITCFKNPLAANLVN